MKLKNVDEPTPEIINEVLLLMRAQFAEHGKDMVADYKLPEPTGSLTKVKREVSRELDYNPQEMAKLAATNESKMNAEKLELDPIKDSIHSLKMDFQTAMVLIRKEVNTEFENLIHTLDQKIVDQLAHFDSARAKDSNKLYNWIENLKKLQNE